MRELCLSHHHVSTHMTCRQVEENFKQAELRRIKEERAKRLADKQREEDLKKIAVSFSLSFLHLFGA